MPCFLGGTGGGENRTRVQSIFQFKSSTGLLCLFPKQRKIYDAPPTSHRHEVPPDHPVRDTILIFATCLLC